MTLTERLREQVRAAAKTCPTCGQPTEAGGARRLAGKIGVSHTTLWRFLRGDPCSSDTLDSIDAWLNGAGGER